MSESKSGFFVGGEACEGRVLVVDDEPDIRKVVKMTLQKAGYEVLEAENGEKAIEVINYGENRLLLDVVICDIRMPKINGAEAIAYFRSNYPRVPLIVLTGFPDADMATSFLRQGVVDYLVKPVDKFRVKGLSHLGHHHFFHLLARCIAGSLKSQGCLLLNEARANV